AGLLCVWTDAREGLAHLSYDLAFLSHSDVAAEGVTILYMDMDSDVRLDEARHAAWNRRTHARLINRLAALHAKAVVFDVLFPPTSEDPAANQELVDAAHRFGRVVLAAKPDQEFVNGDLMGHPLKKPFPALADVAAWGIVE